MQIGPNRPRYNPSYKNTTNESKPDSSGHKYTIKSSDAFGRTSWNSSDSSTEFGLKPWQNTNYYAQQSIQQPIEDVTQNTPQAASFSSESTVVQEPVQTPTPVAEPTSNTSGANPFSNTELTSQTEQAQVAAATNTTSAATTIQPEASTPVSAPASTLAPASAQAPAQASTKTPYTIRTAGKVTEFVPATEPGTVMKLQPSYSGRTKTFDLFINGKTIKVEMPFTSTVVSVSEKGFMTQNGTEDTRSFTSFDEEGNATTNIVGMLAADSSVPFFSPVTHYFEGIIIPYGSFISTDFGCNRKDVGNGYTLVYG